MRIFLADPTGVLGKRIVPLTGTLPLAGCRRTTTPGSNADKIVIRADEGRVTLSGAVKTFPEMELAARDARYAMGSRPLTISFDNRQERDLQIDEVDLVTVSMSWVGAARATPGVWPSYSANTFRSAVYLPLARDTQIY